MNVSDDGDFEWELSKENVKPLSGGRSVDQLNKILKFQRCAGFNQWRQKMRKHFEEALRSCPRPRLLRLYTRYIRWTEENYPALGASADLGDLLFRCVRDTSHLEGIFTDPAYVDVWLKLIDYCDYPLELFSLLFTNGVGTLSARFYLAWVGRLQRTAAASGEPALDAKGTNQIASILVHGLRAYAQPIQTLESYAESFLHFVEGEGRLEQEQHDFERITSETKPNRPDEVRHKLAALRVVGTVTSGASANVPVIRTGNAVDVSQRGLPSLQTRPPAPVPQRPPTGLQVFRDEPTTEGSDGRPPFLRSRAPAPNVKSVSRLAEPLPNCNAENTTRSDLTLNRQTVSSLGVSTATPPIGVTPTGGSRGTLSIFQDAAPNRQQHPPPHADPQTKEKKAQRKPHGLQVHRQSPASTAPSSAAPTPLITVAKLKSVFDTETPPAAGGDLSAKLPTVFFCNLDMLTTESGEERCFEMNKAQSCHPELCPTATMTAPSWADEAAEASQQVLNEIRQIVEAEETAGTTITFADECEERKRARMQLIRRLEAINRNQTIENS